MSKCGCMCHVLKEARVICMSCLCDNEEFLKNDDIVILDKFMRREK